MIAVDPTIAAVRAQNELDEKNKAAKIEEEIEAKGQAGFTPVTPASQSVPEEEKPSSSSGNTERRSSSGNTEPRAPLAATAAKAVAKPMLTAADHPPFLPQTNGLRICKRGKLAAVPLH